MPGLLRIRRLAAMAGVLFLAPRLPAQHVPPRPQLPEGADTNSALAYYQLGTQRLEGIVSGRSALRGRPTVRLVNRSPREAYAAFYWASRLEPLSARAAFGQSVALLMMDDRLLAGYLERDRRTLASPDARRVDSLMKRAFTLDPFVYSDLREIAWLRYVEYQNGATQQLRVLPTNALDPESRGMVLYGRGDFHAALEEWRWALRQAPQAYWLHAYRARAFYHLNALDSARAASQRALDGARAADAMRAPDAYESREHWEYSLGWVLARQGNLVSAGEAYQRALVENLGFHAAHLRLAMIALGAGDTLMAQTELARGLAITEDDYALQLTAGELLLSAGRPDSALIHLEHAARLEPYAPAPVLALARALEAVGRAAAAADAYDRFLALARRDEPRVPGIRARVSTLRAAGSPP
jgi:tetratricopeptide (TPR) repeat protein